MQQPKDQSKEATQSLEGRVGHSQDTLPTYVSFSLSVCISICLFVSDCWGTFPTKEEAKPPPTSVATSSSIPDSICTDLQRAALIIESTGGEVGWGEGGGEPAHCLCMNQGHWKIKADCGEIITDCSCGIILMRLGLTKPCLLYTMASLWDDYC